MNIIIFLGQKFVENESEADLLVNKLLCPRIVSLRADLKENDNIDLPLIRIKDSAQSVNSEQISEKEIAIECDGKIKWKQDFSLHSFENIVDAIIINLKSVARHNC